MSLLKTLSLLLLVSVLGSCAPADGDSTSTTVSDDKAAGIGETPDPYIQPDGKTAVTEETPDNDGPSGEGNETKPDWWYKQNPWERGDYFEGDITTPKNRNGLTDGNLRWPSRQMPYYIDSSFNQAERNVIQADIDEINRRTCVWVRPFTNTDADLVWIRNNDTGCFSPIGRQRGFQTLNLQRNTGPNQSGCIYRGTPAHELLHALGFAHQQSAEERDNFVTIQWGNIETNKEHNFVKLNPGESTNFGVSYDYQSIMHYSAYAFSKNGQPTIVSKQGNVQIGGSNSLTQKDIWKLNRMYGCRDDQTDCC